MKAVRLGICVLVALDVLALGGVEPSGRALLELGAAVLFLLWGVLQFRRRRAEIHGNWLYAPLLALGAIAILQYALRFSVYPYQTKLVALEWAADLLLFFLAIESFRTRDRARRFLWFLLTLGFLVSFFAIARHFAGNGKLFWSLPVPPGSNPFGTYLSPDHFAGFVELVAPLGLSFLLFRAVRPEQFTLLLLFTLVPFGAAILSASRGGIIGLAFETLFLLFLSRVGGIGGKQAALAAALVLAAAAFIVWLGAGAAIQRFAQLTPETIPQDLRIAMDRDTWRIFLDRPWLGTGVGTLRTVYPRYASFYMPNVVVNHAHNDYLELLADAGILGGLAGLSFIVLLFRQALRNLRSSESRPHRAIVAGALAACAGLLVHSLVDFNLHIPANALIFLLLAAVATTPLDPPAKPPLHDLLPSATAHEDFPACAPVAFSSVPSPRPRLR